MTEVRIELFGGLRVHCGADIKAVPVSLKAGALLAFLALHLGTDTPRDVIVEALWPDGDPDTCRGRLRTILSEVRKILATEDDPDASYLIATRSSIRLASERVSTDVDDLLSAIESGDRNSLRNALTVASGDLLPGLYDDWALDARERIQRARIHGLRALSRKAASEDDNDQAVEALVQILREEPLNEEVHCELMRLHLAASKPGAVLKQYADLERSLRDNLGAEPSLESKRLAEEARSFRGSDTAQFDKQLIDNCPQGGTRNQTAAGLSIPSPPTAVSKSQPRAQPRWLAAALLGVLFVAWATSPLVRISKRTPAHIGPIAATQDDLLWKAIYERRAGDEGSEAVAITADQFGNLYVTGLVRTSKTDVDIVTTSYRSDGSVRWRRWYDGPGHDLDRPVAIVHQPYGFVYVIGESDNGKGNESTRLSGLDWVVLKYAESDGAPSVEWKDEGFGTGVRRYNSPENGEDRPTHATAVYKTDPGPYAEDLYIVGRCRTRGATNGATFDDVALVKFDPSGKREWVRTIAGPWDDSPAGLAIARSGNAYVAATTTHRSASGVPKLDMTLTSFAADGGVRWQRSLTKSNGGDYIAEALMMDSGENLYVVGRGPSPDGVKHEAGTVLAQVRQDGEPLWIHGYSQPEDRIFQVSKSLHWQSHGFLISGMGIAASGKPTYRVLHIDDAGQKIWVSDQGVLGRPDWGGRSALSVDDRYVYHSVVTDDGAGGHSRQILTSALGPTGAPVWQRSEEGGFPGHLPNAITVIPGGVVVAGQRGRPGGGDFALFAYRR